MQPPTLACRTLGYFAELRFFPPPDRDERECPEAGLNTLLHLSHFESVMKDERVFNSRESDRGIHDRPPQMYILTNICTQSPCQRSMLCTRATIDLDSKGKESLR